MKQTIKASCLLFRRRGTNKFLQGLGLYTRQDRRRHRHATKHRASPSPQPTAKPLLGCFETASWWESEPGYETYLHLPPFAVNEKIQHAWQAQATHILQQLPNETLQRPYTRITVISTEQQIHKRLQKRKPAVDCPASTSTDQTG